MNTVERFSAELLAVGGQFTLCTQATLAEKLLAALADLQVGELAAWDETALPDGLLPVLRQAGLGIHTQTDPHIKVGLTGALAGVAETGSLLLASLPGQPMLVSLLPEVHLAILRASEICASLPEVLQHPAVQAAPASVLITGPSRTADIEMTLTIGVHGPRQLHVFCLGDC